MRKRLPEIIVITAAVLLAVAGFLYSAPKKKAAVTVGVEKCEGMEILGESLVTAEIGDTVTFRMKLSEGVEFLGTDGQDEYRDGVLYVPVTAGRTVRVSLSYPARLEIQQEAQGVLSVLSGVSEDGLAHIGREVVLKAETAPHYLFSSVRVNGTDYPAKADGTVSFVPEGDTVVTPVYLGEEVSVQLNTSPFGEITRAGEDEIYRYGDELSLHAEYNRDKVEFLGWSLGAEAADGGEIVGKSQDFSRILDADLSVFANFVSLNKFYLSYNPAGGAFSEGKMPETELISSGAYVTLPVDALGLHKEGCVPVGYTDQKTLHSFGSLYLMPGEDVELSVVWAEVTPLAWLRYQDTAGGVTISGFSDEGRAAKPEVLVLPASIDGKPVVSVSPQAFSGETFLKSVELPVGLKTIGALAFSDCPALKRVTLTETITAMATDAFSGCPEFSELRVHASFEKVYDIDYDSALADKYMRLKETEGRKRIILVGGSGLSFGIESDLIKEAYPGYEVLNFSTSVYYGIRPLLQYLLHSAQDGDVLVFALEYRDYMYGLEYNSMTNWQYLESNYDMLFDLDIRDNSAILNSFTEYTRGKHSYLLAGRKKYNSLIYSRASFDRDGDNNHVRTHVDKEIGSAIPPVSLLTEEGLRYLRGAMEALTRAGAKCYLTYPACASPGADKATIKAATAPFVNRLTDALSGVCTPISAIEDYYFPVNYHYDTMYHMTTEGAKVRTQKLVDDMQRAGIR